MDGEIDMFIDAYLRGQINKDQGNDLD